VDGTKDETPHFAKNKELLTKVKLNINKGNDHGNKHLVASKPNPKRNLNPNFIAPKGIMF
jgi:hypothetical protein